MDDVLWFVVLSVSFKFIIGIKNNIFYTDITFLKNGMLLLLNLNEKVIQWLSGLGHKVR